MFLLWTVELRIQWTDNCEITVQAF